MAGLEVNACKLSECEWFRQAASEKNIQTFASSNNPCLQNIWKEFAIGLTSLLVEKILLAKLCKWTEKWTSSPELALM